jgi:mannose-6-phosphate isomerase-like protein (cupin superfamily)
MISPDQVLEGWKARGFHGGIWVDPPGQVWEDYVHDEDELFMVMEGDVELEMSGKAEIPKVGQEILIPAKTVHSVRNLGSTTARWLYSYKSR